MVKEEVVVPSMLQAAVVLHVVLKQLVVNVVVEFDESGTAVTEQAAAHNVAVCKEQEDDEVAEDVGSDVGLSVGASVPPPVCVLSLSQAVPMQRPLSQSEPLQDSIEQSGPVHEPVPLSQSIP